MSLALDNPAPAYAPRLPEAIDAAVRAHGGAQRARAAAVTLLRERLAAGRDDARLLLDAQGGLACARHLSSVMDEVVGGAYAYAARHLYPADNPTKAERIALAATGGYGRGALAPGSDVDLLFLLPYKQTAWGESVVEAVLYLLWDLGLKVGHATRSVEECVREAKADLTVRTALLERRFLLGDLLLFETLSKAYERSVVEGSGAYFATAKLAERETRVRRAGDSRYLVEPNVKDGKGGMRDLQTLFWIAKYVYRVTEPEELARAGLFEPEEMALFARCEEFLWRVRCHLHLITGRAEERLSFDLQPQMAERFGYAGHGGLSGVERFMKRYFLTAKDVGDLTAILCAALEAREAKPRAVLGRLTDSLRSGVYASLATLPPLRRNRTDRGLHWEDFKLLAGRLAVANDAVFEREPLNLIRLFWLADRHGLAIHPIATRLVTRSLKRVDRRLREHPEANSLFLDILTSRRHPEALLRRMNEAGLLGRLIPDFGRVVAMMQFNMYHHYTVDEHLLRAVGALADIEAGGLEAQHPLASRLMPLPNRRALYVAMLLHDIAKGRTQDHSLAGADVARKLGPRFGLDQGETDTAAWLVEHHLLMSTTAQSRDLSDPKTIEAFAGVVLTLERLKLLLVLTISDIKAVGPGVWNGWKGELLRTLYSETEAVLSGRHSAPERRERVRLAQEALRAELADWSAEAFEAYALRHYPAYWLRVDAARKARHARFIQIAEAQDQRLATTVATDAFRAVTEVTVFAPDHPRLLSIIAGACAAASANIADAEVFTTTDGFALDTIVLNRAFETDADELRRAGRITQTIERALSGEVHVGRLVAGRQRTARAADAFDVPPVVVLDNALSNRFTVVETSGLDRPGLLYDLTLALSRLSLNIGSAQVATFGEKAVDVFYVTDLTGAKITAAPRQAAIRRALREVFKRRD